MFQQVDGAVGVAGDGGQRLVEFVAEQRGHLADRGQPCGGLQTLLRGTGQLLDPAPLADVQERAHPARVLALGIDERGLDDQHGKPRAVLAHELGLKPLARRHRARKADGLALAVFLHTLGRPVGCRHAQTQQLLRAEAHHLAKGRVDVGDAALQIARAQPGHQRVFHRLAKGQRIGQITLGPQSAAVVAHQHHHHRQQRNRHGRHQGRQHIGEQAGSAVPAVHAQHQCAARQVQQVLRGKHARPPARRAQHRQPGAVGLGEGGFLAAREVVPHQVRQDVLQRIGRDEIPQGAAAGRQRNTQLHHLRAQAVAMGLKVAAGIRRPPQATRVGAGDGEVRLATFAQPHVPGHRAVGRLHMGAHAQVGIAQLNAHQLAPVAQQVGRLDLPGQVARVVTGQGLQALQVVRQRGADVRDCIGRVALQARLHLAGFVAPGQPHHGDQHGHHEQHQRGPQRPAPPGATPALQQGAFDGGGFHSTRWVNAGS